MKCDTKIARKAIRVRFMGLPRIISVLVITVDSLQSLRTAKRGKQSNRKSVGASSSAAVLKQRHLASDTVRRRRRLPRDPRCSASPVQLTQTGASPFNDRWAIAAAQAIRDGLGGEASFWG